MWGLWKYHHSYFHYNVKKTDDIIINVFIILLFFRSQKQHNQWGWENITKIKQKFRNPLTVRYDDLSSVTTLFSALACHSPKMQLTKNRLLMKPKGIGIMSKINNPVLDPTFLPKPFAFFCSEIHVCTYM